MLAAGFPELRIGFAGVSLAFGLTVPTMAYAVGAISGGHFNPAVSLGLAVARRGYSMEAALVAEIVLTALFLIVILGSTSAKVPGGFAPIAIGLCLTLIHLVSIPVTNTSVNPARSTGVAFYADTGAVNQLWLFWLAPLVGAAIGALLWRYVIAPEESLEGIGGEGAERT